MVIVEAPIVIVPTVTFWPPPDPPETIAVTDAAVLKRQPLGAVRIRVPLAAKSPFVVPLSPMMMLVSVVQAGEVAFWALSADKLVPPVAAVT
jgi:hypothetical protein